MQLILNLKLVLGAELTPTRGTHDMIVGLAYADSRTLHQIHGSAMLVDDIFQAVMLLMYVNMADAIGLKLFPDLVVFECPFHESRKFQ